MEKIEQDFVLEELKKIVRRVDTIQKTLDLLYQDRNILEDILSRLTALEYSLNLNKDHQTQVQKDIKADIGEVAITVEDKMEEVKEKLDNKTVVIRSSKKNIFQKIKNLFNKNEE